MEKNAPRIKKWWDENPEIKDAVTFSGDRTYAINYESTNPRDMVWNKMFVYKPWLDTLNLPIPETTEEFYQTLLAFKNDDPNGNGQKDEIPLIGNISWVAWKPLVYLMEPLSIMRMEPICLSMPVVTCIPLIRRTAIKKA